MIWAKNVSGHCKQTERQPASHARRSGPDGHDYLHIFSHPDYDRRLWHSTRSADPARMRGRSRARRLTPAYRRWGISPRPEDALIAGRDPSRQRRAKHTSAARAAQQTSPKTLLTTPSNGIVRTADTRPARPSRTEPAPARRASPHAVSRPRARRRARASAAALRGSPSHETRVPRYRPGCAGCTAGRRRTRSRRRSRVTDGDRAR